MEGEDVFDEEGDEMNVVQTEWKRSMEKRLKEGYLNGRDAGRENALQSGFNLGYKLGVNMLRPFGELRGTLSALLTWSQLHNPEPAVSTKLNDLLIAVCQCEDSLLKCLSSLYQTPHPSDLSSTLEDMNLASSAPDIELDEQSPCASGRNCCRVQDSLASSLARCRTTQQLNESAKHELCRIAKECLSVAEQLNLPEGIHRYLQTLKY
ncbi:protein YAE1 homolog [Pelobates fuscus]|uniref:protein YAE1 homolog n=1 Tax=Pelobates fuscus TaxID=191477 RepID=UPI002FE4E665